MIVHRTLHQHRRVLTRRDMDASIPHIELHLSKPEDDGTFHHEATVCMDAEQATILGNTLLNLAHELELHQNPDLHKHPFHPRATRLAADATFPPHPAHDGDAYGGRFLTKIDADTDADLGLGKTLRLGKSMRVIPIEKKEDDTTSD